MIQFKAFKKISAVILHEKQHKINVLKTTTTSKLRYLMFINFTELLKNKICSICNCYIFIYEHLENFNYKWFCGKSILEMSLARAKPTCYHYHELIRF